MITGYMKSKMGENAYCMFVNEQPHGGFKWEFLDFKPEDIENYTPIYIYLKPQDETAKKLLKELCDEWDEKCEPTCNSHGHDEHCRSVNLIEAKRALRSENVSLRLALQKIKDGGVPCGVQANPIQRMLEMCSIATEALK